MQLALHRLGTRLLSPGGLDARVASPISEAFPKKNDANLLFNFDSRFDLVISLGFHVLSAYTNVQGGLVIWDWSTRI